MKLKILCSVFILLSIVSLPASADGRSNTIDAFIQDFHNIREFNGTVLVAQHNKILFEKSYGYANLEWQVKHTPDTKFRIASMTKPFTAILILQLVQQGKIALDAPISRYLKYYRQDTGNKVTIHHLLSHTSGVPNYLRLKKFKDIEHHNPYSVDEFVQQLCSEDLEFEPGSQFRYSNSGYNILGAIIENITGKSYWQVLDEHILTPAGMNNTGNDATKAILANRAHGYEKTLVNYLTADHLDMSIPYAEGGMYSTARDLLRWNLAINSGKLLNKSLIDKMYQSYSQRNYGYGWMIDTLPEQQYGKTLTRVHHAGMIPGFNTNIARILEDNYLIIILNNTGGAPLGRLTDGITNILYHKPYKKAEPRIFNVLYDIINSQGLDAAINEYHRLAKQGKPLSERSTNYFGYELLKVNLVNEAIAFFKLNVEHAPDSANAYDSLAEAYLAQKNYQLALANYQKSLTLDTNNHNAKKAIKRLKANI